MACQCRIATLRAYEMLKDSGQREDRAYNAAVRVYRHFHPQVPRVEAYGVVADWLDRRERSGESGRT